LSMSRVRKTTGKTPTLKVNNVKRKKPLCGRKSAPAVLV
jgi:hypothetical protein